MIFFLLLFFNSLSFSFLSIQAVFFCDDYLKSVYILNESPPKKIAGEWVGNSETSYYFNDLNAAPGDLIRIECYNTQGWSFGAGCFVLNNECHCFNFDINNINRKSGFEVARSHNFGNIICSMSNIYYIEEENQVKSYEYKHYIPLDASKISCKNENSVLIVQYGEKRSLRLSNYIITNFDLKNLEVVITENYEYFSLNNNQLTENQKFKILNNLIFYSIDRIKIHIKFKNLGIPLTTTKECGFYIRVCHERCSQCYDEDIKENKHQCIKCKDGFYFVENTNNCKRRQEMDLTKYYLDETGTEKMFKRSYKDCLTNLDEHLDKYITDEYFNTSDIERGKNEIIKCKDVKITLTTTKNEKNVKNNINTTYIDLNECEDILRKEYNLTENEMIFMKKIEVFQKGMKIPKIVYDVYSKLNGTNLIKLDLSFCANIKVDMIYQFQ